MNMLEISVEVYYATKTMLRAVAYVNDGIIHLGYFDHLTDRADLADRITAKISLIYRALQAANPDTLINIDASCSFEAIKCMAA